MTARAPEGGAAEPLTHDLQDALEEIARYTSRSPSSLYWWRRASMAKLADMGLVETWRPPSCGARRKTLPYRITDLGRSRLAAAPGSGDAPGGAGRAGA